MLTRALLIYLLQGMGLFVRGIPLEANVPRDDGFNVDNPTASDPKSPPSSFPPLPLRTGINPFAGKFAPIPASCAGSNMMRPSDQCVNDLKTQPDGIVAFSGGSLKFDDKSCTQDQVDKIETAVWDATIMAKFANHVPTSGPDVAAWKTWIGPDFWTFQDRILGNIGNVPEFAQTKKFDIIMSCKDTSQDKVCGTKRENKNVGGYASTVKGWFGWYNYITLCPTWFLLDNLETKMLFVEDELQKGNPQYAQEAQWQKSQGQFFLHEMMHLDVIGNPHINDELVNPQLTKGIAYGPRLVYRLAQFPLSQGGGATRASTNADSYAWLINSLYFRGVTGYFPVPPKYKALDTIDNYDLDDEDIGQDVFPLHLGDITLNMTDDDISKVIDKELLGITADEPVTPQLAPNALPPPVCATHGMPFPQPPVEDYITDFCSNRDMFKKLIVPPVSFGNGKTGDGRTKVVGVVGDYPVPNSQNKLWLGLVYTHQACMGTFQFAVGKDDQASIDHCKVRLGTILNGCQTGTTTAKLGGKLNDVCAQYYVTQAPPDEQPFANWFTVGGEGSFDCAPTNTSVTGGESSPLKGTCTCSYSGFSGQSDLFKMPPSNNCVDVKPVDLLYN